MTPEGRYNHDRSFLWNLVHYKSVDYARFTDPGEDDKIRIVLQARFFIGLIGVLLVLALLQDIWSS